ncbi:MAG: valine--tRNA ligase [Gemmatimonadetes bacterium]|nr:valine--tRNA ligase [Gemmatimonadota bacterium]MDA1103627.1 valine--tRNA ligase [Gemmatimonadota bacterium]
MTDELAPRLDPRAIEPARYRAWQEGGYFHVPASAVLEDGREPYVIVIPPPNVTAALHMGHGLNNTVQDVLIRWRRMQGRASLWVPGTDHAGIATQNVIERQLAEEGLRRDDLGREKFVERVWEFVAETGGTILEQLKAIGASCDWDRTRFTLDEDLQAAVREVFVSLYEKDLIYRGEYIINWCPRCLTALSNEEAEGEETEGSLWHLRYPLSSASAEAAATASGAGAEAIGQLSDGRWYLTVSTTRPETMLGDTGVAVYPSDARYSGLIGAQVEVPLTGRLIPIVADRHVDPEFGSGMVKVTPAHDKNDFEIAGRTGLELLDVMTPDARMGDHAPEAFRGMDRFEARKAVLAALEAEGLLAGEQHHAHSVPHCYRCHTVVEPRLSEQWFVSMKPLAEPALAASQDGTITFTPGHWKKVYEHWMENIQDWCISRQLWWGHRIPVWYCPCGERIVARVDPTACSKCGGVALEQDPDVLDTWFSSQLWPFSVFGWPKESDDLKAFYPGHTMVTAPEILFFWVARMIMMGYEFQGKAPFTEVYLHGTVRDIHGRKMSKSLGNGIDPMRVVEEFGADAMRYTVISQCAVGTDISLDHEDVEAAFANGRNFANKIWNAGRFALMSLGDAPVRSVESIRGDLALEDEWILSRLEGAAIDATRGLDRFRLHEVAEGLYHFFWGEICDWYLELVKTRLGPNADPATREAARSTLVVVLDQAFRLLHPIVPFVTAELWARLPWPEGSERPGDLIVAPWPTADGGWKNDDVERRMSDFQNLIVEVRRLRKEYGVPDARRIGVDLTGGPDGFADSVVAQLAVFEQLARVDRVGTGHGSGVGANAVLPNGAELFIPLEGVIDVERERSRMLEEVDRLEGHLRGAVARLNNDKFTGNAPADVVQKERDKVAQLDDQASKLRAKLAGLEGGVR